MLTRIAAFSLLLLAFAPFAGAEDDVQVPDYSVKDLIFTPEDMTKDWTEVSDDNASKTAPTASRLRAVGTAIGVAENAIHVESRTLRHGPSKGVVVLTLVDIDADPKTFTAGLKLNASVLGWNVSELGSPMRLLIASSGKLSAGAAGWQKGIAVYKLAALCWSRLRAATDREEFQAASALLAVGTRIVPDAGVIHATMGRLLWAQRQQDAAAEQFALALKKDVPLPPKGALAADAAGNYGLSLLLKEDDDVLPEALRVLKMSVDLEEHTAVPPQKFNNRYNLACAYARLGKKDEALAELDRSLALGKEVMGADGYAQAYTHCKDSDPDMSTLRDDVRFEEIMKKHAPDSAS